MTAAFALTEGPTTWHVTDDEKWPIKTQNVKVSLTGCVLYTKSVKALPFLTSMGLLYFTPLSWGAEERGEQLYTQRDEALQGGPELIRPPQNTIQLDLRYIQEEKSIWRTITDFSIFPLKLPESFSSFLSPLVYHLSPYSNDGLPPNIIFFHFSPCSLSLSSSCRGQDNPAVWWIAKSFTTLQWMPHPLSSIPSTARMYVCILVWDKLVFVP